MFSPRARISVDLAAFMQDETRYGFLVMCARNILNIEPGKAMTRPATTSQMIGCLRHHVLRSLSMSIQRQAACQ